MAPLLPWMATWIPTSIFSKLARHVSANALDDYVSALEMQIQKYLTEDVNYGKAAKRMYNVFRLTGRYAEAAFVRELFDEPATVLYQVWSLIRTLDDAVRYGSSIPMENLVAQADQLIMDVVRALEGGEEAEIVRRLLRLRDSLTRQKSGQGLNTGAEAARAEVINVVNNFFHERLTALPSIERYMEGFQE
jgi:meiotically up-regulated gene 157 (Mug157) protein